jgi:hypothetical protein
MTPGARAKVRASVVPVTFLLLAGWICVEAFQVPFGSFRMPGAGFFPLALGLTLAVCAAGLLAMHLLDPAGAATEAWPERREVLYLVGSVVAAVWLFERAGFLLTMALFLAFTTRALGRIAWPLAVALALGGSVAAYVVFSRVLQIALPSGPLPF